MEYKELDAAKPQNFFICHDGSEASQEAMTTISKGLLRDCDKLQVCHAWSNAKEEYLKYNFKKDYIRKQIEAQYISLGERFHYIEEEIKEDETAKEVLNNLSKERHASLCVVGFHGRKGPKADPTVMGTAVQYMSVNTSCPTLIIKDPNTRESRPDGFTLAICCDGSKKALSALTLLCEMRGPKDKIHVIICEQANIETLGIKETVNEQLEEMNCLQFANCHILSSEAGKQVKDIIREHLTMNTEVDFIFIGNQGADFSKDKSQFIGSVANEIIRHTKLNTIFVSQ